MNEQVLDMAVLRIDGDTQPRVAIDQAVVQEYADAIEGGAGFPPVDVVHDGTVCGGWKPWRRAVEKRSAGGKVAYR
jgi:hypothetical protein